LLAALLAWLGAAAVVTAVSYRWLFTATWLLRPESDPEEVEVEGPRRFALLIPAHDEELLVEAAIRSARTCDHPANALAVHVIADNCTDRTAEVARSAGAEVLVRNEPGQRGKGQALAWGLARLDLARFDAVAIVDADNLIDPGFFREMNHRLACGDRILQGYDGISNPSETMLTRLIAVTSVMKNLFFYGGKSVLGLSSLLMGTGMVFATPVLREASWTAGSIGEDLEQSLDLLSAGERIRFVPEARVYAQEASSFQQGTVQRQRWSTGRHQLRIRAWRALREGIATRQWDLADAGAELLLPTYAMTLNLTLLALLASLVALPVTPLPLAASLLGLGAQAAEVGFALREMRASRPFVVSLLLTPVFLLWRGAIDVLALFGFRGDRWSRTARRAHSSEIPGAREER
jgi:cellulose synthase/poly-beta-1,6-N-acetylglucosamine synthase-like glycosyltransferase